MNAEHVKIVSTLVSRQQEQAGRIECYAGNHVSVGDEVRNDWIAARQCDRCSCRRTSIFDWMLQKWKNNTVAISRLLSSLVADAFHNLLLCPKR